MRAGICLCETRHVPPGKEPCSQTITEEHTCPDAHNTLAIIPENDPRNNLQKNAITQGDSGNGIIAYVNIISGRVATSCQIDVLQKQTNK